MSSANLMELVRELKSLNERKKSGDALSPDEAVRRKELKEYLRVALDRQKSGEASQANSAAVTSTSGPATMSITPLSMSSSAASVPSAAPISAPIPVPVPVPVPQPRVTPAPMPAAMVAPPANAYDPRKAFMIKPGASQSLDEDMAPEAPKPKYESKNAYAIQGFDDLMNEAASSDVVSATFKQEKAAASRAEIDDATARADAALRAQKKREHAVDAETVAEQLVEIAGESGYTAPEEILALEDYYGDYIADDGFEYLEYAAEASVGINVIDPREMELHKAGIGISDGTVDVVLPAGLAFLDDFGGLYTSGILPSPADDEDGDIEDPNLLIPGRRKVTVHLLNGTVKRGVIRKLARGDLGFNLDPVGAGRVEEISFGQVKAVFIHIRGKEAPMPSGGRTITVTFRDRRTVQGVSDDYQPGSSLFSLIPTGRGVQFERIIVNSAAVTGIQ